MAISTCAAPIKGTHIRIIALDSCGVPVTGASGMVSVSKAFIQVEMEPQYEDGTEFFQRTAGGDICVNQIDDPALKRMQLTVDLCEVNAVAAAYVTSARLLSDSVTGTGFAVAEGSPTNRFSLEVWQQVAGSSACDASGAQRYIYNAWPNVGATQIGKYTVELDRSTLQFISQTRGAAANWDTLVGASWLPDGAIVDTDEHWVWNVTTTPPPVAACDTTTL